jgi:uncharacterized protein YbaA (DUF1428 family)
VSYVDGFVIPIPKKGLAAYKRISKKAGEVWMDHGALEYFECAGDDLKTPMGVPFAKLAKVKAGETVVFSFIVYKSRKDRDRINAKVMKDKRITGMGNVPMPFDVKRMSYGGFKSIVEMKKK